LGISDLPPVINAYNQFALPKYCGGGKHAFGRRHEMEHLRAKPAV
jgi:hypothetical protein